MIFFNQILPELYVGTYPEGFRDIEKLKRFCGITAVLNLQTDEDLRENGLDWSSLENRYGELSVKIRRVPIRDFDYEDQRRVLPEAVRTLAKLLASGHTVYLHCNAGAARSPLVAMAYLYWCRDLTFAEAVRHVQVRRPCSPYEDLIEVSRQDLLKDREVQKEISQRASELARGSGRGPDDHRRYLEDAEREILRKSLGLKA